MRYKQTDPKYKNIKLGLGDGSMFSFGCYLFALVDGLNDHRYNFTPEHFNDLLIANGGYIGEFRNYIDVERLNNIFPDIFVSFKKVEPYNDVPSVTSLISPKTVCVCKVDAKAIGGSGSHFVLLTGVIGKTAMIFDPWTGTEEKITLRYGKLGNILGLRIFEIKSATIEPPANSGNMEPVSGDQTKIDLGNPWGVLELQAIRSRIKDNEEAIKTYQEQVGDLGKLIDDLKSSYGQEIIKLTEKAEAEAKIYAYFLSKMAELAGTNQEIPLIISAFSGVLEENTRMKKKLEGITNNQPIVIHNGLSKVVEFIESLVIKLKQKNGTTKKKTKSTK